MLQSISAAMQMPELPSLLQTATPATMPMSDMGNLLQNAFPMKMTGTEFDPIILGSPPISDINMGQEQTITDLVAERMREQECLRLPARALGSNSHLNIDQIARVLPSSSGFSHPKNKVHNKRQFSATSDGNIGASSGWKPAGLTPHAPKLAQQNIQTADAGKGKVNKIASERCSLTGVGFADDTPVSDQQKQSSASSAHLQQDSALDLAASASKKLIISASECSTKMVSPILVDDGSKEKHLQIGKNTEMDKALDEDIDSFFSNDEAPDDNSTSFGHISPQGSSAPIKIEDDGFSFEQVRSLQPAKDKLSCCDFSTMGNLLVAAGHEKKVFIWDLKQSTKRTIEAHSQLITDIRFKPESNIFATTSFDRSVKIWNAVNVGKPPLNLVGHAEHVTSLDFHPKEASLLCSCDSNDEIRLWSTRESTCVRSFKGANTQVRFQARHGKLLAAASGNVINLIDVETGKIQYCLEGHAKDIRSICWDICGQYLVSVSEDSARVWSPLSRRSCMHKLLAAGNKFASCTFHPGYAHVVVLGSYQSIDIWNTTMKHKVWNVRAHEGIVSALAENPETNTIASVSHDQWVKIWK